MSGSPIKSTKLLGKLVVAATYNSSKRTVSHLLPP